MVTAAGLLLVIAIAGCVGGQISPGERSAGKASSPARIVSLVPAVTEMLFAIGAGPRVMAVSSFDHYPQEVERLERVGGLLDPDVERIISLRPDLVIAATAQEDLIGQLKRAGIPTFVYSIGGLEQVMRTLRGVGKAVGMEREANREASRLESALDEVRQRAKGQPRPRTLLVFGREPGALRGIDASGGIGFLHDLVQLAGGDNVYGNQPRESLRVSTEAIIDAAPEVILELHYGDSLPSRQMDRERAAWNALPTVPAVRSGRIHLFAGDAFVIPGMRLVEVAQAFAEAIHRPGARSGAATSS
jgi:iron complex transport system substrate-binding protein